MEINQQLLETVEKAVDSLEQSGDLEFEEILELLKRRRTEKLAQTLPLSIFNNASLSALETIVKYLKENIDLNYSQIAKLLARNYDPIAITYRNAKKKMPEKLELDKGQKIPIQIFANKKLSILENLATYLKEKLSLSYHEIAISLNRNDRTIWTVYNRAKKKQNDKN